MSNGSAVDDDVIDIDDSIVLTEKTSDEVNIRPDQGMPARVVLQFNLALDAKPKTRDECRERLMQEVENNFCWGSGPAKKCNVDGCTALSSFHCKLESFVEVRTSKQVYKPYRRGTPYTSLTEGVAPNIWRMQCDKRAYFSDATELIEIPYTSTVETCFTCRGKKHVKCTNCRGDGKIKCTHCGGDGRITRTVHKDGKSEQVSEDCRSCHGGQCKCMTCGGDGKVKCNTCNACGQIRYHMEMRRSHVTLVNQKVVKDNVSDSDLPDGLIQEAKGATILQETEYNIAPPSGFNDKVDQALRDIDNAAKNQINTMYGFLHQERLTVTSVPITYAQASLEGQKFRWYIYGSDDRIQVLEYPATMCCGCQIA